MRNEYIRLYDRHGGSLGATNEWQRVPDAADYIIFKDGDVVKAKNGRTGKIEFESTSLSELLTKINDSIPELTEYERWSWEIVTKPTVITFTSGMYVLDAPVKLKGGILIDLNGSWLDLSQIDLQSNEAAITLGNYWEDENSQINKRWIDQLSGIVNGTIKGCNGWAIKTIGFSGGLVFRNLTFDGGEGGIWFKNLNYDAVVENTDFRWVANAIKIESIDDNYAVNGLKIDNCFMLCGSTQSGTAITISSYSESITITNSWFENYPLAIEDHGKYTKITNNSFSCRGSGKGIYTDGASVQILGNYMVGNGDNAVLIELAGAYHYYRIENNHLYVWTGADTSIIKASDTVRVNVTGNIAVQGGTGNSSFIEATSNRLELSVISSNVIRSTKQEGIALRVYGNSESVTITGNTFYGFQYHIGETPNYSVIEGNTHLNYGTDILERPVKTTAYCDKAVYTSLPDTSNALVSAIFKGKPITVHDVDGSITGTADSWWIFVWDGSAWRKVQLT